MSCFSIWCRHFRRQPSVSVSVERSNTHRLFPTFLLSCHQTNIVLVTHMSSFHHQSSRRRQLQWLLPTGGRTQGCTGDGDSIVCCVFSPRFSRLAHPHSLPFTPLHLPSPPCIRPLSTMLYNAYRTRNKAKLMDTKQNSSNSPQSQPTIFTHF